jgi:hypothetical protein
MREGDSQGFIYMAPPSMDTPRDPTEWTLRVRSLRHLSLKSALMPVLCQIGTNDTAESLRDERWLYLSTARSYYTKFLLPISLRYHFALEIDGYCFNRVHFFHNHFNVNF